MVQPAADLILINGRIWTVNRRMRWAESVVIRGDKIIFVGSASEAKIYVGDGTRIIDLRGNFAMPGFNDAHVHFDENLIAEAKKYGITTIQDISIPQSIQAYQDLLRRDELTVRVLIRPILTDWKDLIAEIRHGVANNFLKCNAVKGYIDGMMCNNTAVFFEEYKNAPGNYGRYHKMMIECDMENLIREALSAGLTPHIHAIGDKANNVLLNIYKNVINDMRIVVHRFRVIHAQVVYPSDFKKFGELKLVAEVNPFHCIADMRWMEEKIGDQRCRGAYAFRTLKKNGALLCFGSDYPGPDESNPYPLNPLLGIYAAVTRQTLEGHPEGGWFPEERLTVEEAIEAYTVNPAIASFEENKGTLDAGKLADIVVLSKNIISAEPSTLLETETLLTILAGDIVYRSPEYID
ncbi:MAG: amidohydrolase family protein [Nitrospirae bacterium]|nr:amidohydrolase family protein [Nitrospirota bacterium]